jgi:hypothetical protein
MIAKFASGKRRATWLTPSASRKPTPIETSKSCRASVERFGT